MFEEVNKFRHGLASLLKYDWVPVPLVYPQVVEQRLLYIWQQGMHFKVIFLAVRCYFIICLIGRQFLVRQGARDGSAVSFIFSFFVFIFFLKISYWMRFLTLVKLLN